MRLSAGQSIKKALQNLPGGPEGKGVPRDLRTIWLEAGNYPGGDTIKGFSNFSLIADHSALPGGARRATVRAGATTLKLDGCSDFDIVGLAFLNATKYYGCMIVGCTRFRVVDVIAAFNRRTGLLISNSSEFSVERGSYDHNRDEHGIYVSQSCDNFQIITPSANFNGRCGIQINAHEDRPTGEPNHDSISKNFLIVSPTLNGNQIRGGAAAINLACCQDGEIRGVNIGDHRGRHGIAMWDDGIGKSEYACHRITLTNVEVDFDSSRPEAAVSIGKGCSSIHTDDQQVRTNASRKIQRADTGDNRKLAEEWNEQRNKDRRRKVAA